MAAISDILQLRAPIEESMRAYFLGVNIFAVTRQNQEFVKKTPRIEIKALIGQATGHFNFCPDGKLRYDCFRFQFSVQAVTMIKATGPDANHELFVGKVREYVSSMAYASWTDTTNFPNTLIAEPLRDTGTQDTLASKDGMEYSVLSYSGIISIRKTAWPTS